jgi:hypothetical protein
MRQQGVALLDLNSLFSAWADTARYPLFPWGGTHWNAVGAALSADTIIGRVEHLLHTPLPRLRAIGAPVVTDTARGMDADLSRPLNLFQSLSTYPSVYPRLGPAPARTGEQRPNLLLVGDSFSWGLMFFNPFIQHSFAPESRLWYYNSTVYLPDSFEHKDPVASEVQKLDLRQQVESRQIVLVLVSEGNLYSREFGLTPRLFDLYHPESETDKARIKEIEQKLASQQSWETQTRPDFAERMHEQAVATYYLQQ